MKIISVIEISFEKYIDSIACDCLSDEQFELEYQGLFLNDKCRYLIKKGKNISPEAIVNNVII